jgi:hypothetical protein
MSFFFLNEKRTHATLLISQDTFTQSDLAEVVDNHELDVDSDVSGRNVTAITHPTVVDEHVDAAVYLQSLFGFALERVQVAEVQGQHDRR